MIGKVNISLIRVCRLVILSGVLLIFGVLSPIDGAESYSLTAASVSVFAGLPGCDSTSSAQCGTVVSANRNVTINSSANSSANSSVQSDDLTMATEKINEFYALYSTYFGAKSGGIVTGSDSTYFAQWFANGLVICAWSDGIMYYYNGAAWYSFGVAWKTIIPVPANFRMGKGSDGFRLSWDSVSGAAIYYIYWGNDDSASSGVLNYAGILQTSSTLYDHAGASLGHVYYYRIKACDSNGNCSSLSDYILMEFGL